MRTIASALIALATLVGATASLVAAPEDIHQPTTTERDPGQTSPE